MSSYPKLTTWAQRETLPDSEREPGMRFRFVEGELGPPWLCGVDGHFHHATHADALRCRVKSIAAGVKVAS